MGLMDDLGGANVKKKRKQLHVGAPAAVRTEASRLLEVGAGAYLGAQAGRSAEEMSRPNCAFALITSTPATPIPAATATGILTFTLPEDTWIEYWSATQADEADFLVTSLKVAGYDYCRGSALNLAGFLATMNRIDRPGPLVGRKFGPGVTVEGNFLNTNAAAKVFHGLTMHCISTACMPSKGTPAPGIFNFGTLRRAFKGLLNIAARKRR